MNVRSDPLADLSPAAARQLLALLVLIAAAVYAFPLWWGIPFERTAWAFDEIVPRRVAFQWDPLYPPTYRYCLRALYGGVEQLSRAGLLGLEGFSVQDLQLLAARSLTVLLACLTLVGAYRCARLVLDRAGALLAVVAFGFGTNFVFYAKTANLDVPYLFWFVLSLFFFLRCLRSRRWFYYLLFAACGSLAIATKSQAVALYPLAALVLVLDLWRAQPPGRRSLWRALLDRRILEAVGVAIAVLLVVFGELGGSGELRAHLRALLTTSYGQYRTWTSPAQLVTQTLANLSFNLGVPVLAAAAAGLGLALYRLRANARLLWTLVFAASYYAAFIVSSGFNYDRHYLPITFVLALFAGRGLAALLGSSGRLRWLGAAAVALVVAHALLRGLSVDLMLAGDARYEVERWLAEEGSHRKTAGLGDPELLPRGLAIFSVRQFARWRRGEHGHNPMVWNNCRMLDQLAADFLIPDDPGQLGGPGINYIPHLRFRNRAPWSAVDFARLPPRLSNIVKIARDFVVFRRTEEECVDSGLVPRALHELRYRRGDERRELLARRITDSPAFGGVRLAHGRIYAVRIARDAWTVGTQPAGLAIDNHEAEPLVPRLRLDLRQERAPFPIRVFVDDGETLEEHLFEEPEERAIELPPVDPGAARLFIVWTDRSWRDQQGNLRGVRLRPELSTAAAERFDRLSAILEELSAGQDSAQRADFIHSVLTGGLHQPIPLGPGSFLVGGWWDRWTHGTRPAGIIVRNAGRRRARVRLAVSCAAPPDLSPLILSIEDGGSSEDHAVDCRRQTSIRLGRLESGEARLWILRPDRSSIAAVADDRPRGILVRGVRLIPKGKRKDRR